MDDKKKELNETEQEQVNGGSGDNPCYNTSLLLIGNCEKCGLYSSCKNPNKPSLLK